MIAGVLRFRGTLDRRCRLIICTAISPVSRANRRLTYGRSAARRTRSFRLCPSPSRAARRLAIREFAPSYRRGAIMQASLAIAGSVAGILGGWQHGDMVSVLAALLLGAVVPFTLIVILPTNKRLLDPALDLRGAEASRLLAQWGRLHAIRSVLATAAFLIFVMRLVAIQPD